MTPLPRRRRSAALRPPCAGDPASFAPFLRSAAARRRRQSDSGLRYEIVVALLWFTPSVAFGAWQALVARPPAEPLLNWPSALVMLGAGFTAIGALYSVFGPVSASREWRTWLLSTPLSRRVLLRRRVFGILTLSTVPGIVLGAILASAGGFRGREALAVVVAGMAAAVAASALAVRRQRDRVAGPSEAHRWWPVPALLAIAVAVRPLAVPSLWEVALWATATVAVIVAVPLAVLAMRWVGGIGIRSLADGSGSASSLAMAVADQSLAPLAAIGGGAAVRGRRAGSARSRPLTGVGSSALASLDRRRAMRNRAAQIRMVALIAVPYLTLLLLKDVVWGPVALTVVASLSAVGAISGLCTTVRQFAAGPHLADRYGIPRSVARRTSMTVPYLAAIVWASGTAPIWWFAHLQTMAVLVPAAAMALVEYRATRPAFEPAFVMGQMYPADLGRRFAKGPAQLLVVIAVLAVIAAKITVGRG